MNVAATVWVVLSVVGFSFAAFDVASAYGHYSLVKVGWPEREQLIEFSRNQMLMQGSRALLLMMFLAIGVNSLSGGPSWVFTGAMIIGNAVVAMTAVRSHFYRRKVFKQQQKRLKRDKEQEQEA